MAMDVERSFVMGRIQALKDDIDDWCPTRPKPFPPRHKALRDWLVGIALGELTSLVSNSDIRQQLEGQVRNLIQSAQQEIGRSG